MVFEPAAVRPLLWIVAGSGLLHLLLVAGEATLTHATAHARLAAHEMTAGRYRGCSGGGSRSATLAVVGAATAAPSRQPRSRSAPPASSPSSTPGARPGNTVPLA